MITLKVLKRIDQNWFLKPRFGGTNRLPTFVACPVCECFFGPVENLRRKYCSVKCKSVGQTVPKRRRQVATKEARRAQSMVAWCVKSGKLKRPRACESCGKEAGQIEAAHYDYAEPLKVSWLCCSCHRRWDKSHPKNGTLREHKPSTAMRVVD